MIRNFTEAFFRSDFNNLLLPLAFCICISLQAHSQDCQIAINSQKIIGSCGSSHTGFIQASVVDAVGPFSIYWKGSNSLDNSTLTQSKLHPGTYILTVQDNSGCSATRKFQVSQQKSPVVIVKNQNSREDRDDDDDDDGEDDDKEEDDDKKDNEYSGTSDGTITLKVNGTPVETVFWLGPEGILEDTSTKLKNLSPGAYTYVVFGKNGCSTVGSVIVN